MKEAIPFSLQPYLTGAKTISHILVMAGPGYMDRLYEPLVVFDCIHNILATRYSHILYNKSLFT